MAHSHKSASDNLRRVKLALILTGSFMVVEVVGGVLSGSLALLADAGHMLTDTMALALTAAAFHLSARPADAQRSYGYSRFQILAAFVNGLSLIVIVGWILFEAVRRFITPIHVIGETMLVVAAAGLVVNIVAFLVLHGGDQNNLNMRGAALHVAGDLLGSVAAIVAAIIILATGWMPIDPILSVVVAMLIFRSAWKLVRRSAHVLLEGVPEGVDTSQIHKRIVENISGVSDVHHIHVWGLTPEHHMLTMHIVLFDETVDGSEAVKQAKAILRDNFAIAHSTIEVETDSCADS
jgi:cobalt-zinc-cadmium efflux system protein